MKRSLLLVPLFALVAAWLLWPTSTPAAPAVTAAPDPADRRVDAVKLREVQAVVAEKNREASKDREAFLKDGWTMVAVPPPDHALVNYDPRLISEGRERDLKQQLLSTVPSVESVRRVGEIARK